MHDGSVGSYFVVNGSWLVLGAPSYNDGHCEVSLSPDSVFSETVSSSMVLHMYVFFAERRSEAQRPGASSEACQTDLESRECVCDRRVPENEGTKTIIKSGIISLLIE